MMFDRNRSFKSNEDLTKKISHSIFVTNFPDSITSQDLWRECNAYGTVVDVFIPVKKSKLGNTGMNRDPPKRQPFTGLKRSNISVGSYANVVNGGYVDVNQASPISTAPALVAKELFTWSPNFAVNKESTYTLDDESVHSSRHNPKQPFLSDDEDEEEGEIKNSVIEGVAETIFEEHSDSVRYPSVKLVNHHSEDSFSIHDLLEKKKSCVDSQVASPSLSHPPGYTPEDLEHKVDKVNDFVEPIEVNDVIHSPANVS
uniref:RNA-directed DNA polymerase, eukaryota, nucleotide-binding alpha-beta plait domain protein n=1 Tax=Tanacetum cinerariifolium TaxID=118510 RepID=A0A6L2LHK6_TANCI|nr:RNA-directed DNA polymerase, eukaryota, nucleotide-binding alpha-beta plait domain protein [Tanacetum cinerariifolium]